MFRIMRFLSLAVMLAVMLGGVSSAQVVTGEAAPEFTLTDTNGQAHTLSDFRGKFVVLEWFNPDCPFVRKHYDSGNMQTLQKDYAAKGVVWLVIDSSALGKQGNYPPEELNARLQADQAAPTAVFIDADGVVGQLYGAKTTPHMFIINPEGQLIYQGAIDSNPSFDAADIATSENYVRSALDAALAGQPVVTGTTKSYGCSVKY